MIGCTRKSQVCQLALESCSVFPGNKVVLYFQVTFSACVAPVGPRLANFAPCPAEIFGKQLVAYSLAKFCAYPLH